MHAPPFGRLWPDLQVDSVAHNGRARHINRHIIFQRAHPIMRHSGHSVAHTPIRIPYFIRIYVTRDGQEPRRH